MSRSESNIPQSSIGETEPGGMLDSELAPANCCADGVILHGFQMELTSAQARKIKALWKQHGRHGAMIIMQPVINWGPFDLKNCVLNSVVVDIECAKKIKGAIESANRHND